MQTNPVSWFNGEFLPDDDIRISPHDRGFVFADGTYDVFRSYSGKLFFIKEHLKRLEYCLKELKIDFNETESLIPIVDQLIKLNDLTRKEATVYLQITRGVFRRMHPFPSEKVHPTIYINVREFVPHTEKLKHGVKCISLTDLRWHRCDIKTIALLPNIMAKQEATEAGAYEAIFIRDGFVTEGTHTNVFGIKNGIIYTHPQSNHILSGISREILIDLCLKNGFSLRERAIPAADLAHLDELLLVGTSTEVMPVIQLNGSAIANGKPGPITRHFQQLYHDFIRDYLADDDC